MAFPEWLQTIADEVGALVADPDGMEYFQAMVREWKDEHAARDPEPFTDENGLYQPGTNPVRILPEEPATEAEKIANLAAIHDALTPEGRVRIDPWHFAGDLDASDPEKMRLAKEGAAYAVLESHVEDIPDNEAARKRAQRWVEEVMRRLGAGTDGRRHGPDFRFVMWDGQKYTFTSIQSDCVEILWEAMENGTPDVGDSHVLDSAGSDSNRLAYVFRDHPAWDKMIIAGGTRGTHRLAPLKA